MYKLCTLFSRHLIWRVLLLLLRHRTVADSEYRDMASLQGV